VVIKAEQVKYRSTRPLLFFPPFNSLALTHAPLIWALTRLQASGLAESIMRKERGRAASTLHTHRQASLNVSRYTTLVPPLTLYIGLAREAGLSTGTRRGHVPSRKRKKDRQRDREQELSYCRGWPTVREQLRGTFCKTPIMHDT